MAAEVPIHILIGEEQLLVREAEDRLTREALGGAPTGFNFTAGSAGEGQPGELIGLARTQAMLSRRRVVVIRDLERADAELIEALLQYAEHPNPSTTLLLTGLKLPPPAGGKDRGRVLANQVKKIGEVRKFEAQDANPLRFVAEEARRQGCVISPAAAELLVALTGADLLRLRQEVAKLSAWVGGSGEINGADVDQLCALVTEARIWDLTDAIAARDVDAALGVLQRVFDEEGGDGAAHRLLAQVAWKVRQLLELQSWMRASPRPASPPASWARENPQRRRRIEELLTRRPMDPVRVMASLARTNQRFHRSGPSSQHVFESLVLELLQAA